MFKDSYLNTTFGSGWFMFILFIGLYLIYFFVVFIMVFHKFLFYNKVLFWLFIKFLFYLNVFIYGVFIALIIIFVILVYVKEKQFRIGLICASNCGYTNNLILCYENLNCCNCDF